jgi:hypothetical protein
MADGVDLRSASVRALAAPGHLANGMKFSWSVAT